MATLSAVPAVFDLARIFHATMADKARFDRFIVSTTLQDDAPEVRAAHKAFDRLHDEAEALDALILARPIATLADGLALAVHGSQLAEGLEGMADGARAQVQRAFDRLAVLLSRESGVPLTELGCSNAAALIQANVGEEG